MRSCEHNAVRCASLLTPSLQSRATDVLSLQIVKCSADGARVCAPERVRRHAEHEQQQLHLTLLLHREFRGDGARQRHERQHRDAREEAHEHHERDDLRGEAVAARAEQRRVREAARVRDVRRREQL